MRVIFTKSAARDWARLPKRIQAQLRKKLNFFISQDYPLDAAIPMKDHTLGQYRFRIGDYRIVFDVTNHNILVVIRAGHRKDIYR